MFHEIKNEIKNRTYHLTKKNKDLKNKHFVFLFCILVFLLLFVTFIINKLLFWNSIPKCTDIEKTKLGFEEDFQGNCKVGRDIFNIKCSTSMGSSCPRCNDWGPLGISCNKDLLK